MAQPFDIVGYTYRADTFCPACIVGQITVNPGDVHHKAPLMATPTHEVEQQLDLLARIGGTSRDDEHTFDSDDFPKVIFRDMMRWEEPSDICGQCSIAFED